MGLPPFLVSGDAARLIPVAADSNKETRATSILLSTMMSVSPFARAMLSSLGQRVGTRAGIDCYTEIVLKAGPGAEKARPDGLLILDGGRGRLWQCLVEAKVGAAELGADQIEKYLALAKANGLDAVLTISNQFVALPTHAPVKVSKLATRGIELFHWSWMYLLTEAMLLLDNHEFDRPEQRYILAEMVRYFSHPSTGVSTFDRMNPEWKDLIGRVQSGAHIPRTDAAVERTVAAWHQEVRDLCLLMTRKVGRPVRIRLSRAHTADPNQRVRDECGTLAEQHELSCSLEIPDAAAPVNVLADVQRRTVFVSISLATPADRHRTTSKVNWLVRQLTKTRPEGIYVRALWPGRAPTTQASLSQLREDPGSIQGENQNLVPSQFEVRLVRDLAGKFSGTKTFIQHLEEAVPYFYQEVGQYLRAYVPPPPQVRRSDQAEGKSATSLEQVEDAAEQASIDAADDTLSDAALSSPPQTGRPLTDGHETQDSHAEAAEISEIGPRRPL